MNIFSKDSWLVKITDPGGILREDGFLGWNIFGFDHTSEDAAADAANAAMAKQAAADAQLDKSLKTIKHSSAVILTISIIIFVVIYGLKKGYISK